MINPAHNNAERTYAFATFVQTYMKDPARVARRHHRGFSKRLDDRRRQISRAKEFIAARDKKAYGDITLILSIIVGTYITKILVPMLLYPKLHNIAYV